MALRLLLLTLIFSINVYAKPADRIQNTYLKNKLEMSAQPTGEIPNKALTSNPWQISRVFEISKFSLNPDRWYFNFDLNGKYKAYGACNFISGTYKIDAIGNFKISTLDSSNNECNDTKDQEVTIFNELLMADSFEINENSLILKSADHPLIEFQSSDKTVNFTVPHKVYSVQKTTKSHGNKRTKGPKASGSKVGKGKSVIKKSAKSRKKVKKN